MRRKRHRMTSSVIILALLSVVYGACLLYVIQQMILASDERTRQLTEDIISEIKKSSI